jgi:hypothetical protein
MGDNQRRTHARVYMAATSMKNPAYRIPLVESESPLIN